MHQGSILVLRDGTRASEITLTLLLAALVAEDPMSINSLKQLVLLSIALDKDLPSDEWPKDLQALLEGSDEGTTIPRRLLARALEIAGPSILALKIRRFTFWSFKSRNEFRLRSWNDFTLAGTPFNVWNWASSVTILHIQLLSIFIIIVHSLLHHVQLPASSATSLAS